MAARIGLKLLADNQTLRNHNEYLEEQLLQATDKVVKMANHLILIIIMPTIVSTFCVPDLFSVVSSTS